MNPSLPPGVMRIYLIWSFESPNDANPASEFLGTIEHESIQLIVQNNYLNEISFPGHNKTRETRQNLEDTEWHSHSPPSL